MSTAHDIGMRSTAGDYPPEHDAAEREERRLEAIRAEAEGIADDMERGRTEQVSALLDWSWLYERATEGLPVDRDVVIDALVDAISDDVLGSSRAPGWVRRERQIREQIKAARAPIENPPESTLLSPWQVRQAIRLDRHEQAVDEIARIVGARS